MKKLLKKIYNLIPYKKNLFTLIKLFWIPPPSIYQHLHFIGPITVSVNKLKSFKINHYGFQIENEIFWTGLNNGYEKESLKIWIKLCEKCDTIIDIGANTGVYSLIAKSINSNANVYAFEPVNRVYKKLVNNLKLNNYDIIAIEKAISNKNGIGIIYDTLTDHIYSVTVNKNLTHPGTKVVETTINTITLDSFIKNNFIKEVSLLKIDVETHEAEVLEGFKEYLYIYTPTILIEILNDEVGKKVQDLMNGLEYLYFNIDEKIGARRVELISKLEYNNYLLCNSSMATNLGLLN